MPKLSTYPTRVLSKIAGLDVSGNVGLAPTGMFFADATQASILAAALAANNSGGGRVMIHAVFGGTVPLTQPLPDYNNVTYEGAAWGADFRANRTTASGGVILQGDGTFNAYEHNPTDGVTAPTDFTAFVNGMLVGGGLKNLTLSGFKNGVKLGSLYNPGGQYCIFENLYFINNVEWDVWNENGQANQWWFIISQTTGIGGIGSASSGDSIYNAGNDLWFYPEVLINAYGTRGMVFWGRGTGTSTRNMDIVHAPEIGSLGTTISQVATITSGSANITVTDGTKFPVGMPCTVDATGSGFTANQIYFVKTQSGNTITLANTTYGTAITASATTSPHLLSKGFAHFEVAGLTSTTGCTSTNIYSPDTEGSCTTRFFFQNAQYASVDFGYVGSNTGTNEYATVCLRNATNCSLEITHAFSVDADALSTPNKIVGNTTATGQVINKQQFNGGLSIGTGATLDFAGQAFLSCPGANSISMVNGTSPQALQIYNTSSGGGANTEYGIVGWDALNDFQVGTGKSGTGSDRPVIFKYGGGTVGNIGATFAGEWQFSATVHGTKFTTDKSGAPATVDYIGDRYYSHILAGTAYVLNSNGSFYGTISHFTGDLWGLGASSLGIANDSTALQWDGSKNVMLGGGANATNATNGFAYLPTVAGTPSGTPTSKTGFTAVEYDTTNDALVAYNSTWLSIPVEYWIRQHAAYTLSNSASVQKLFNGSTNGQVTLQPGVYWFDCVFSLSSMSATSGNAAFSIASGTGTATNFLFTWSAIDGGTATAGTWSTGVAVTSATPAAMATASTATTMQGFVEGTFEVTVAGTFIPSIQLANAAAAVNAIGSYFRCKRIAPATATSTGPWT